MIVAFYFLLGFREYTKPRIDVENGKRVSAERTEKNLVINVGCLKDGKLIARTSPLQVLI